MARSFLAVLCALLVALASPLADRAFEGMFGASGCCDTACCCLDGASCGLGSHAMPKLVSACGCGHHDNGPAPAAPDTPRVGSAEAATLPELQPRATLVLEPARVAECRRAAPDPPPPRRRD